MKRVIAKESELVKKKIFEVASKQRKQDENNVC